MMIQSHLANIRKEIIMEEKRKIKLDELKRIIGDSVDQSVEDTARIESELENIIDFSEGQYISRPNQLLVQVLEATGLISSDLNGLSNPYVKVSLKHHTSAFKNRESRRSTYFIEKSLSPAWSQQIFVFDLPEKAARDPKETRNFSVQCTVKSMENALNNDKFLGQVGIQLRDLLNQKESIGWYPLMGELGKRDVDSVDRIRGSIRLRIQYVTDHQGLMDYYLLCSERRISTLKKTKLGMQRQLKVLRETAKQNEETRESLSLVGVPALTLIGKKKRKGPTHPELGRRVRDGTENRLKKSIGMMANSVGRRRKRGESLTSSNKSITANYEPEDLYAESNSREVDIRSDDSLGKLLTYSLEEVTPLQNVEDDTNTPICTINLLPRDLDRYRPNKDISYVTSLRDRCWGQRSNPLAILPHNSSPFLSWNTSRAYMHAKKSPDPKTIPATQHNGGMDSSTDDLDLALIFKPPPSAPTLIVEKERNYVCHLMTSRHLFSKKARRSLNSVINPGGGEFHLQRTFWLI
jgi:hypothetical protein